MSKSTTQASWYVYMIETESNKLYTGITTDVARRFDEHLSIYNKTGNKGAKFFRSDKPIKVVFVEECVDKSQASKKEYEIKQLTRRKKIDLLSEQGTE